MLMEPVIKFSIKMYKENEEVPVTPNIKLSQIFKQVETTFANYKHIITGDELNKMAIGRRKQKIIKSINPTQW